MRQLAKHMVEWFTHLIGRVTRRYYFEDYIRVYPDQVAFNRFGKSRRITRTDRNNYLNHRKYYRFVAQFVRGKTVTDVGCGSGYGCEMLVESGAARVVGCDISRHALEFARRRYGKLAEFIEQGITDLHQFPDASFDVTISSEVLEHIKEYQLEDQAVKELKRVTKAGGIVIVGTPNSELLGDHGFSYDEMHKLFATHFEQFVIFENALVPWGGQKQDWVRRLADGRTGVIVSENINLDETDLPESAKTELKHGLTPGRYRFQHLDIDTTLLHNTHSWIVIAIKS